MIKKSKFCCMVFKDTASGFFWALYIFMQSRRLVTRTHGSSGSRLILNKAAAFKDPPGLARWRATEMHVSLSILSTWSRDSDSECRRVVPSTCCDPQEAFQW